MLCWVFGMARHYCAGEKGNDANSSKFIKLTILTRAPFVGAQRSSDSLPKTNFIP